MLAKHFLNRTCQQDCKSVGYLQLAILLVDGYLHKYPDVSIQRYYEAHIKEKLGFLDLCQISDNELTTKDTADVRATFEPKWTILNIFSSHLSRLTSNTEK